MEKFSDESYLNRVVSQAQERSAQTEEIESVFQSINTVFDPEVSFEEDGSIHIADQNRFFVPDTFIALNYDSVFSESIKAEEAYYGSRGLKEVLPLDQYRRITRYSIKNNDSEIVLTDLLPQKWSVYAKVVVKPGEVLNQKGAPSGIATYNNDLIINSHPLSLAGIFVFLHESGHAQRLSNPDLEEASDFNKLARKKYNNLTDVSVPEASSILEDERAADAFAFRKLKHFLKPEYLDIVKKSGYKGQLDYREWMGVKG